MELWDNDSYVTDNGIDVPQWINQDITCADVAAIAQGGCESGAWMEAVTYHKANDIMSQHGDEVLEYLETMFGELPSVTGESWSGIAVRFLSAAVDLWATIAADELEEMEDA